MFKVAAWDTKASEDSTCRDLLKSTALKSRKNRLKKKLKKESLVSKGINKIKRNKKKTKNKLNNVKDKIKEQMNLTKSSKNADKVHLLEEMYEGIPSSSKHKKEMKKKNKVTIIHGSIGTPQNRNYVLNHKQYDKNHIKKLIEKGLSSGDSGTKGTIQSLKNKLKKKLKRKQKRKTNLQLERPEADLHSEIPKKHFKNKSIEAFIGRQTRILKNISTFNTKNAENDTTVKQNLLYIPNKISHEDFKRQKRKNKLLEKLNRSEINHQSLQSKKKTILTLRDRMMEKLKAARFRYLNEQIYSTESKEAQKLFNNDPDSFKAYHEGYRQQVSRWPINPLDVIIKSVKKMPRTHIIADFGCGDAKLAKTVEQKVHSFDLVATNNTVTACDMAHVPLPSNSVDVAVFCLSLMGTNLHDYLLEANRVLKIGGILKIAEVESRFDDVHNFIQGVQRFHFKSTWKDLSHNLFYFLDFKKESNITNKKKLPTISLQPCLYKKR